MTDEELGLKIVHAQPGEKEHYLAAVGRTARTLLAARPEVTREAVEKWCVEAWGFKQPATDIILAALSHFAPAREARPIDGMSVEEIEKAFLKARGGDLSAGVITKSDARVAHRLAQPVPVVDADAEAKRLAFIWWLRQASEVEARRYSSEEYWCCAIDEDTRNGWRAVAAAKEAEREDHE